MLFKKKSGWLRGYYFVASGLFCRLFIGLFAVNACVNCAIGDELKDAEHVFHSLKKTARELRSCRLVVAFRETKRDVSNKIKLENVTFADMWIDHDAIQCKELRKDKAEPTIEWWDGFNWDSSPFSAEKLEEQVAYPSYLRLFVDSHSPNSATYTPSAPGLDVHIGVFSENKSSGAISTVQVPFLGLDRMWKMRRAEFDLVLADSSPTGWNLVGNENVSGFDTIKYRIVKSKREFVFGDQEKLAVAQVFYLWFAEKLGYIPVRFATTTEYLLDEKWFPLVGNNGEREFSVDCEITDVMDLGGGILYPRSGIQTQKTPANIQKAPVSFSPDSVATELRQNNRLLTRNKEHSINTSEWKVLEMRVLPGGMDLWLNAPLDSLIMRGSTVRIAGKSLEESKQILGAVPEAKRLEIEKEAAGSNRYGFVTIILIVVVLVVVGFVSRKLRRI